MLELFKWFKNRNKKKHNMSSLSESSIEELVGYFSPMEFEWIKGDYALSKESFKSVSDDGENKFIIFMSGKRINLHLLDEFMVYFPAPQRQIPAEAPAEKNKIPQKSSSVTSIVYDESPSQSTNEDSPIYKLLKKQKKNQVEVGIKFKLNLPSKDLYSVLSSSFEDAEREIINFVLDGVDIEDIKLALADSIKKNYYALPHNSKTETIETVSNLVQTKKRVQRKDEQTA